MSESLCLYVDLCFQLAMRTYLKSINSTQSKKSPFGILIVLGAAVAMLAIMAPTAVFANPGLDSACDASTPTCTSVTIAPGATVTVSYDHTWDAPVCTVANANSSGYCTGCVWTSNSLTDTAHACSSDGSLSLTSSNGFTF